MKNIEFYETIKKIVEKDDRYQPDSYEFINDAVIYTVEKFELKSSKKSRHVTGAELVTGVLEYAIKNFGPLAYEVFCEWGVKNGPAIGNIVFNMLDHGLLSKTENDSREDFNVSIDFAKTLRAPFLATGPIPEDQIPVIN